MIIMSDSYHYARYRTILFDKESRHSKAEKIFLFLQRYYEKDLSKAKVLDIGCSAGHISFWLSERVGNVVGVDIDQDTIDALNNIKQKNNNIKFKFASADALPFDDASFDIVICNIMYYLLTPDRQEKMLYEIRRCLRRGGVCYFAGPNKLLILERKYNLPFLPWLPVSLGRLYVKICSNIDGFDEYSKTLFGLKSLCNSHFVVEDVSLEAIDNLYHYKMIKKNNRLIQILASFLCRVFYLFLPSYIFILRPKNIRK